MKVLFNVKEAKRMHESYKKNSILERWEIDAQSYKNGASILTAVPQCETCANYIKGNALHCKHYDSEKKPTYVLFPKKECPAYNNNNPIILNIQNDMENKTYGGLFGFCIGDVLGVPVEFSTREEREIDPVKEMRAYGTYHQSFGTWSDDTSLTLCLVDAINRGYSIKKVGDNFANYYEKGYLCAGGNPEDCGGKAEGENGNGALMRVLPIAFYGKKCNGQELIKLAEDVSSLTHGHNRSKLACIFYVEFAIQIILGYEKAEALERTIAFIKYNCAEAYSDEFRNFNRILNKEILNVTKDEIKSTGYVVDTLEAVLWTFFHTDGYREAVLKAINLGGDTDTTAAIVGGIAGIYYGLNDIPNEWLQSIAKKEELYNLFEQFCAVTG